MTSDFAVVFTDPADQAVVERLKQHYPRAYTLVPERVYLVKDTELTSDIARKVGFKGEPRAAKGVVFRLNHAYSGYTDRGLWEWLE